MQRLVTKESLQRMLEAADLVKRQQIVGRALVALFARQTASEQRANSTDQDNGIGFASCDAKQGSISAKTFMKRGALMEFQMQRWLTVDRNGFFRITKYHRQLNEVANEKRAA